MWFWQKCEVYMGPDGVFAQALTQALEQSGIAVETTCHNGHNVAGVGRSFGRMGTGSNATAIYYVYAKHTDEDAIRAIMSDVRRKCK